MKKVLLLLAATCVLLPGVAFAQADILQVIPEKSLFAVIAKDAATAEAHLREMVETISGKPEKESPLEELLRSLKLRPQRGPDDAEPPPAPADSVIELKAPLAVVLVVPALDVEGMPLGAVVKVGDYKKFLAELAKVVGAAAPEVTPDGTDVLRGAETSLFVAPLGAYAVVADAEYVVRTFQAEAQKNLAKADLPALRDALAQDDLAVYLNLDETVVAFAPQIAGIKMQTLNRIRNAPPQEGAMLTPEKMAKVLETEFDWFVAGARQVDAVCVGARFSAEGVRTSSHVQAKPNTEFARIAAMLKPATLDLLQRLDGPALMAGAWDVNPEIAAEMLRIGEEFAKECGLAPEELVDKEYAEAVRKIAAATSGPTAFVLLSATEGKGLFRIVGVESLKPDVDLREDLRNYFPKIAKVFDKLGLPVRLKTKLEAGVETHRGAPVDRLTVTFEQNPEAPDPARGPGPLQIIEALVGPELVVYFTQAQNRIVYTMGFEKSDTLKAAVDRVLDGKPGSLTGTPAWKSATAGLPPAPTAIAAFSYAEFIRMLLPQMMGAQDPDLAKMVRDVAIEKPSGIGFTFSPAPKGLAAHLHVPMDEMQNIKTVFTKVMEFQMKQFRERMEQERLKAQPPPAQ